MADYTDYEGRVYDFLALQNVQATGDQKLELALFSPENAGQICTGVQKLAQRWLLEFMTIRGSMPGLPTRGSGFMRDVAAGRLRTTAAVITQFSFAAYDVRVNLAREENDTWPDDERIAGAEIQSVSFEPGYAKLYVIIFSRAGNARQVVLPINTLPNSAVSL